MFIGIELVSGEILITLVETFLDRSCSRDGLLLVEIFCELDHAGVRIAIDYLVAHLLDHAPGVLDDCPPDRCCC